MYNTRIIESYRYLSNYLVVENNEKGYTYYSESDDTTRVSVSTKPRLIIMKKYFVFRANCFHLLVEVHSEFIAVVKYIYNLNLAHQN